MPHEFVVGVFEPGDDDMADFLLDIWLPFARDECKWTDNLAPTQSPELVRPEGELWICRQERSGSPLAVDSPLVTKPPYAFYRFEDRHWHGFTGTGINEAQEIFDQPGNPANAPSDVNFSVPTTPGTEMNTGYRCLFLNSAVGPYEGYWLFSDTEGSYIHCVLKVSSREYRHWHVGMLQQIDGGIDLDPDSFYMTSSFWSQIGPERLSAANATGIPANAEHDPYVNLHRQCFRNIAGTSTNGAFNGAMVNSIPSAQLYMPNLSTHTYDWYALQDTDELQPDGNPATKTSGVANPIGDVNTTVQLGTAQSNAYDGGIGALLYACDRNFTANANVLVPIYIGVNFTFQSDVRLGVVATVPDMFRVNMRDYDAEQTITVGGNDYKVFPVINDDAANVLADEGYSAYEGIAYRVETGAVP